MQQQKRRRKKRRQRSKITLTPVGKLVLIAILFIAIIIGIIIIIFGGGYKPDKTGIFVKSDGTILAAEVTDFDNSKFEEDRYDDDELEDFVDSAIEAFNQENKTEDIEKPVSLDRLSTSSDKATLILKFATPQMLVKFYGTLDTCPVKLLEVCEVSEGDSSVFEGMLDKGGNATNVDDIKDHDGYTLIKIIGNTEVQCDGDIEYYSSNLTKVDETTIDIIDDQTGYIIFD